MLVTLRSPASGKVAVEVKALFRSDHLDRDTIVILQQTLWQNTVVCSASLDRVAANHQTRFLGVYLPRTVRIFDTHLQDAPIAVQVLARHKAVHRVIRIRIVARARADDLWLVRQRPFGAIRVDARYDVKGSRIQGTRSIFILFVV